MGEYGRIVGESSGAGGGGFSRDLTGQVMAALSDAIDGLASLPPEAMIALAAVAILGLVVFYRR